MSEARVDRLEEDMHEIRAVLGRLEPMINRIDAQLPHLATKAELTTGLGELRDEIGKVRVELADKPGKTFLAVAITLLLAAYGVGLAGLAALPVMARLVQ
jgi:lipoate synthase